MSALEVVAVVRVNNAEALVLNRPLDLIYEQRGMDFVGTDGPFEDLLSYSRGGGRFVAFAGRPISIKMADGSTKTLKDHWWSGVRPGVQGIAVADVEALKKCYVFSSAAIAPDALQALRVGYTGCVYPYWDYQKVITFDDMRSGLLRKLFHEERRRKALTAEVKAKHRRLLAAGAAA